MLGEKSSCVKMWVLFSSLSLVGALIAFYSLSQWLAAESLTTLLMLEFLSSVTLWQLKFLDSS